MWVLIKITFLTLIKVSAGMLLHVVSAIPRFCNFVCLLGVLYYTGFSIVSWFVLVHFKSDSFEEFIHFLHTLPYYFKLSTKRRWVVTNIFVLVKLVTFIWHLFSMLLKGSMHKSRKEKSKSPCSIYLSTDSSKISSSFDLMHNFQWDMMLFKNFSIHSEKLYSS